MVKKGSISSYIIDQCVFHHIQNEEMGSRYNYTLYNPDDLVDILNLYLNSANLYELNFLLRLRYASSSNL